LHGPEKDIRRLWNKEYSGIKEVPSQPSASSKVISRDLDPRVVRYIGRFGQGA